MQQVSLLNYLFKSGYLLLRIDRLRFRCRRIDSISSKAVVESVTCIQLRETNTIFGSEFRWTRNHNFIDEMSITNNNDVVGDHDLRQERPSLGTLSLWYLAHVWPNISIRRRFAEVISREASKCSAASLTIYWCIHKWLDINPHVMCDCFGNYDC